ncbi:glycoside hydrolase family 19 protein [Tenacibaculum sp.]|uniref:glycoside hydrolase family 19 protein n=1 Tax=Tenacibaculum sp. TaxID=1906242 RepID=UPI003D13F389
MITVQQLRKVYRFAPTSRIRKYIGSINKYMEEYEINTPDRIRMFLAQIGHESGQLRYTEEIASGEAYEGRKDLGNTEPGDGVKYKGRGLIQITGKSNYLEISKAFGISYITAPELLAEPEFAVKSAAWWWKKHGLNELADTKNVKLCTKRINGGFNGLEDRTRLHELAKLHIW